MKVAIINGPNLNLLGTREPGIYGNRSFEDFLTELRANHPDVEIEYFQSNHEGELVEAIQQCAVKSDGLIINAAAYTHTSIALSDAVRTLNIPVIEVHISNIFAREKERHHSTIAAHAVGVISGFGLNGYLLALTHLKTLIG
jgi:3-dehydroquinate dehydratase-2